MKKILYTAFIAAALLTISCNNAATESTNTEATESALSGGQSAVQDDESQKDVVKVAASSPKHTNSVAAVKKPNW